MIRNKLKQEKWSNMKIIVGKQAGTRHYISMQFASTPPPTAPLEIPRPVHKSGLSQNTQKRARGQLQCSPVKQTRCPRPTIPDVDIGSCGSSKKTTTWYNKQPSETILTVYIGLSCSQFCPLPLTTWHFLLASHIRSELHPFQQATAFVMEYI